MSSETPIPAAGRPRIFYGYIIMACMFIEMLVILGGTGFFGIFFKPVSEQFQWSRAAISAAFSLNSLLGGLAGIFMGKLNDRYGPRLVITFCGILVGAGFMLMSVIDNLWHLFFFYGVLIGAGMAGAYVPMLSTIARWFKTHLSLISGIVLIGLSVGELTAAPIASSLIQSYGWRDSYLILGAIILIVSVIAAQFMKRDPATMGLKPYGENLPIGQPSVVAGVTLREAALTSQFWTLIVMEFAFGFITMTMLVHLAPHITDMNIPMSTAAVIMAVCAGASIPGRLILGQAGDRIGNRAIFLAGFFLMTGCLIWLIFIRDSLPLFFCAAVFGFAFGGMEPSESPIVAWLFGIRNHGLIFGSLVMSFTVGAAIGPFLTGYIFDTFNSYLIAFIIMGVLGMVGFALTATLKPLLKNKKQGNREW